MLYPKQVKSLNELTELEQDMLSDDLGFDVDKLTLAELNEVLQNKNEIAQMWEEQMEWERNQYCMGG